MAKFTSIKLLDEEINLEQLVVALCRLSSRDLRKYFKRKKLVFPRTLRYSFLVKAVKKNFQAIPKEKLSSDSRVFTEFELVEFYKSVDNDVLATDFKREFLTYLVKNAYGSLLLDNHLVDLVSLSRQVQDENVVVESIYDFLVNLNGAFIDFEENTIDCLPTEITTQKLKDGFTLFEIREFAKKYGVAVPKYPQEEELRPIILEKVKEGNLVDEKGYANLEKADSGVLLSFAKKHRIFVPRYLKKDEMVDEIISEIVTKEIDNAKIRETFTENLITFKSRSSSSSLADLADKYENLDDLSEIRNDNNKDMSPLKRLVVGGAIGIELRYNEEARKLRLAERRKRLDILRHEAELRRERLMNERKKQELIAQREEEARLREEEIARRESAEARIAELEALLAEKEKASEEEARKSEELEASLRKQILEEEERRLAAEKALEDAPKFEIIEELDEVEEEVASEDEEEETVISEDEIVTPEYYDTEVKEENDVEELVQETYMAYETVNEAPYEIVKEEVVEEVKEEVVEEVKEEIVEEVVEEVKEEVVEEVKEKVHCKIRRKLFIKLIVSSLIVAALIACYFLLPDLKDKVLGLSHPANIIVETALLVAAAGYVSLILRNLFHPILCKARKGKECCPRCEGYKYLLTLTIVSLAAVYSFAYFKLFHFDSLISKTRNLLAKIFTQEVSLSFNQDILLLVLFLALGFVVTLVLTSITHFIKYRKGCNHCVKKHFISFNWTYFFVTIILVAASLVVYPTFLTNVLNEVKNAFNFETIGNREYVLFAALALFVLILIIALVISIRHSSHCKHCHPACETVEVAQEVKEEVVEEVKEEVVEEEKLLFTTFEEAKLVEDLNDLQRMIGKVNEHVKDLSAIQARLYNELVGEEEIVVEPLPEEVLETKTLEKIITEDPKEEVIEEAKEEVVEEEKEEVVAEVKEKVHCKVKRNQGIIWIFALVLIAAAIGLYFVPECKVFFDKYVIDGLKSFVNNAYNSSVPVRAHLPVVVAFGAFVLVMSLLLRTIAHAIGCKAKKGKHCCQVSENYKYLITCVVVAAVSIAIMVFVKAFHFDGIYSLFIARLLEVFDGAVLNKTKLAITLLAFGSFTFVVTLLLSSFIHALKSRKSCTCCHTREFIRFNTILIFVAIVTLVAVFVIFGGFRTVLFDYYLGLFQKDLSNKMKLVLYGAHALAVLALVFFFLIALVHKKVCRKCHPKHVEVEEDKEAEEVVVPVAEDVVEDVKENTPEAPKQISDNHSTVTNIYNYYYGNNVPVNVPTHGTTPTFLANQGTPNYYEDISSPTNMYRVKEEKVEKSSILGGFFKGLLLIAVAAGAVALIVFLANHFMK